MASAWIVIMILAATMLTMSCERVGGWKVEEVKGWKGEEVELLQVGGKVLCQDCTQGWNHWAHGATPIKGSTVAVTCVDARKRVVYYRSGDTDGSGEFDVMVSRHINGKDLKPEGCLVRLVSSPEAACSVMTDFGGGKAGTKLYRPSHVYPGMIKYMVGPFYFTSPMCDELNTLEPGQGKGY